MKTPTILLISVLLFFASCKKDDDAPSENPPPTPELYFPEITIGQWDSITPAEAGWNEAALPEFYDFMEANGSRAFIVLKEGKIVIEKYWGTNVLNTAPFTAESNWYWASAGKTLTAMLTGIAQSEGMLDINDKTADYLGQGWTSAPAEKEDLILIRHQLTMTTGLDFTNGSLDCTDPECLEYKSDAGTEWYYYNAPYTLLESVISAASQMAYNDFTDQKLEEKIGMAGTWLPVGENNVYWSTARDAARFGLLLLNEGVWASDSVLADPNYFSAMTNTSQDYNQSYGYLTWLNGKESIIYPGLTFPFNIPLSQNAPADMYAAMGKNGQFINVVPSKKMVVIRMGQSPDGEFVPMAFHDEMWERLNEIIE